jgi:cell division protein FtsN
MTKPQAYTNQSSSGRMRAGLNRFASLFFCFSILLISGSAFAQSQPAYDEISVFLDIPRVGGTDISAVISGNDLYLPVTDLFDFLKIRNVPASDMETITGFFINPEAPFTISRPENLIRYQDKTFNLQPGDIIKTETNLYLRSSYYGKVFGMDCSFNFRNLSVTMTSKLELPLIREMRQEEMRRNLNHLKGVEKADTTIGRTYPAFKFGMADWSVDATEDLKGQSEARLNLALGAMVAGGEANASLYYNSQNPFTEKQQFYLWRHVNNDFEPLKQVMIGKIPTNAISSLFNPVIGVQLTNTPTTFRRSFGTYTLSDRTEPGWIVELYVNNVLVDYVKADASGFFTFQVPLVYGNSQVHLKFFGPWGEERVREQNINIPFNFLPKNTFEYNVGAGFVEDSSWSRYSKASINYGVTRKLTVGGGVEYLSSVKTGPTMPYANASISILNNLLLSGEYTYGVRSRGTLTYRLPSNLQFDVSYTKYKKGQEAIIYNYLEERKAVVSMPLRIKKFSTYQRFTIYEILLPASKYTTAEWLFSGSLLGVSTNLTTYGIFIQGTDPNIYSNLSLAARLPAGFVLMPQVQYGYTEGKLLTLKIGLEKRFLDHAYMNMSYENNFSNNLRMAELGFRYDFTFAQTGLSVRQANSRTTFVQYARGSLINDSRSKYLGTDNRTNVGKGGISIIAFLDINDNGKRDQGEPKVSGLNLHANGGRLEKSERDSTIRILSLEPYTNCLIDLDQNSFENISWRLPFVTMSVAVDPNILKNIEIPIAVVGEASGHVMMDKDGEKSGLERIIVSFFNDNLKLIGKTLTENDGYYSFFGLAPGNYTVRTDTAQLRKLGMTSHPELLNFSVAKGMEGDIVDSLDFTVKIKPSDTTLAKLAATEEPSVKKDTTYMIIHEVAQELVTITEDSWAIQFGAFREKKYADIMRKKIEKLLAQPLEIVREDNYYKVRISDIKDRENVDKILAILRQNGITEVWVIHLKAKQTHWVIRESKDSTALVSERILEKPLVITSPALAIQVGAFFDKSRAEMLRNELSKSIKNKVVIVNQNGLYKVRIIGFASLDDLKKFLPSLDNVNLHNTRIIKVRKPVILPATEEPQVIKHEFELPKIARPDTTPKPDTTQKKIVEVKEQPVVEEKAAEPAKPTISIHVAAYHKKSQALKAQRRIAKKLNMQAEIVQQFEYYHVLIKGFYTREETYKYYPELAGIGYPGVTLIDESIK